MVRVHSLSTFEQRRGTRGMARRRHAAFRNRIGRPSEDRRTMDLHFAVAKSMSREAHAASITHYSAPAFGRKWIHLL